MSTCPYAFVDIAKGADKKTCNAPSLEPSPTLISSNQSSRSNSLNADQLTAQEALKLAKSSCPAFTSSCPFRDVGDAEGMKKALASLPPSHLETRMQNDVDISQSLRAALQHVHTVSQALHSSDPPSADANSQCDASKGDDVTHKRYEIQGGCPFKTAYQRPKLKRRNDSNGDGDDIDTEPVSFVSAMEEFSLSAIMGRLADDDTHPVPTTEKESINDEGTVEDSSLIEAMSTAQKEESSSSSPSSPAKKCLSTALKIGTAESHSAAESVHFVKNFIKGNIDKTLYSILISNLYFIYQALEEQLQIHAPVHFSSLHFPNQLNRTPSLEEDVEYFHGLDWKQTLKPSRATLDYISRLTQIARDEPLLLLSHAYTRYLGDLSGGRILARVARKALRLSGQEDGLRFYMFDEISNPKRFKDEYRNHLDSLDLELEQLERLVAEANVAFVLNMRVFEELDVLAGVGGAFVRPYEEAVLYFEDCVKVQRERESDLKSSRLVGAGDLHGGHVEDGMDEKKFKCPFAQMGGPNPHAKNEASGDSTAASRVLDDNDKGSKSVIGQIPASADSSSEFEKEPKASEGRCPWPFIFFHDPATGMRDYQTWVVIALFSCWIWSFAQRSF